MPTHEWYASPLFGIAVTVIIYALSLAIARHYRQVHPLLLCSVGIILLLLILKVPYAQYANGGAYISFLLGPATVALAVPLYIHWKRIMSNWKPVLIGIVSGTVCSISVNLLIARALGASQEVELSLIPKSATTPISMELVRLLGGIPELGAVFTVLTGLFGSVLGTWFLGRLGVKSHMAIGLAMGASSHGIGTAKVLRDSEEQGAFASFAMGSTGILITLMTIPLYYWLGY